MSEININFNPNISQEELSFSATASSNPAYDTLLKKIRDYYGKNTSDGRYLTDFFVKWANGGFQFTSWEDFMKTLNKETDGWPEDYAPAFILDEFTKFFVSLLGISLDSSDYSKSLKDLNKDLGQWNSLRDIILKQNPNITVREFFTDLFKSVFAQFAKGGFNPISLNQDVNNRGSFLEAFLLNFKIFVAIGPEIQSVPKADIDAYRKQYFSQFPDNTEEDFLAELEKFYNKMVSANGFFMPSFFYDHWVQDIQGKEFIGLKPSQATIFYDLLNTLSEMVGVLQRTALSQAQLMSNFYTPMLKLYTDLIADIPIVTLEKVLKFYDNNDKTHQTELLSYLSQLNQTHTEKMRNFRTVMQDEVKAHSSGIEQTQQAVQQQLSMYELPIQSMLSVIRSIIKP